MRKEENNYDGEMNRNSTKNLIKTRNKTTNVNDRIVKEVMMRIQVTKPLTQNI